LLLYTTNTPAVPFVPDASPKTPMPFALDPAPKRPACHGKGRNRIVGSMQNTINAGQEQPANHPPWRKFGTLCCRVCQSVARIEKPIARVKSPGDWPE